MSMSEPRYCRVCGKEFMPVHANSQLCSEECRKKRRQAKRNEYRVNNYNRIRERNREWMRQKRGLEPEPEPDPPKPGLIAEGYAQRQIEKTLSMVPKIDINL